MGRRGTRDVGREEKEWEGRVRCRRQGKECEGGGQGLDAGDRGKSAKEGDKGEM